MGKNGKHSVELYDHQNDSQENLNIASHDWGTPIGHYDRKADFQGEISEVILKLICEK